MDRWLIFLKYQLVYRINFKSKGQKMKCRKSIDIFHHVSNSPYSTLFSNFRMVFWYCIKKKFFKGYILLDTPHNNFINTQETYSRILQKSVFYKMKGVLKIRKYVCEFNMKRKECKEILNKIFNML